MINNQQISANNTLQHLLELEGLNKTHLESIIQTANGLLCHGRLQTNHNLANMTVANLFFEPSTRTRNTFELAAGRCGAKVINIDLENSATKKNESLLDTMQTLEAMQIDIFVIRHKINGIPHKISAGLNNACVINAGDGTNAHPTQALLDMMTICQHKSDIANCSIAIVGDIMHSRVAHSDIQALLTLGVQDIRLIAPEALSQPYPNNARIEHYNNIDKGIQGADVIIILRLQKERMLASDIPNESQYFQTFGLTRERLKLANPKAIVMHPGPINREVEIASDVADSKQSTILPQVSNGIAIRMAVMSILTNNK